MSSGILTWLYCGGLVSSRCSGANRIRRTGCRLLDWSER